MQIKLDNGLNRLDDRLVKVRKLCVCPLGVRFLWLLMNKSKKYFVMRLHSRRKIWRWSFCLMDESLFHPVVN